MAYADDDDMYVYGNMNTDPNANWKHSQDSLTITGNLPGARGRFADLKLGTLREPGGLKKVAVKMNKRRHIHVERQNAVFVMFSFFVLLVKFS